MNASLTQVLGRKYGRQYQALYMPPCVNLKILRKDKNNGGSPKC